MSTTEDDVRRAWEVLVREASYFSTVKVRGDAVIRAEPDEAMLWITLTALEDSPSAALRGVSARANALVEMLDGLGIAKAERSTTGVTVHEEFEHGAEGRRSLGYRAATRVSVRLNDHELIGGLIERAVEELAARIDGPHWQIAPDNPARLKAAREAAADAQRKARLRDGIGGARRWSSPSPTRSICRSAPGC